MPRPSDHAASLQLADALFRISALMIKVGELEKVISTDAKPAIELAGLAFEAVDLLSRSFRTEHNRQRKRMKSEQCKRALSAMRLPVEVSDRVAKMRVMKSVLDRLPGELTSIGREQIYAVRDELRRRLSAPKLKLKTVHDAVIAIVDRRRSANERAAALHHLAKELGAGTKSNESFRTDYARIRL